MGTTLVHELESQDLAEYVSRFSRQVVTTDTKGIQHSSLLKPVPLIPKSSVPEQLEKEYKFSWKMNTKMEAMVAELKLLKKSKQYW